MKRSDEQIFGASWLARARSASDVASWASEVIADYDTTGKTYLDTIRQWFDGFSAEPRDKNKLRGELENFSKNSAHVAGVNELAWWTLMKAQGMLAAVVPTTKSAARPDFEVHSPFECYIEVTTLNVSQADETAFAEAPALMEDAKSRPDDEEDKDSVSKHIGAALDRNETIRRLIWNSAKGKLKQLKHATDQKKPAVLVVFDYTAFSAYATDFNRALGDSLLGVKNKFANCPAELSALVYVERKVLNGRIALSLGRSSVYYNPLAIMPLKVGSFSFFRQVCSQLESSEPESIDGWINL